MKFFATVLASAYAATVTESANALPTMMDTAETSNTASFATDCGQWAWILYGATDSADEEGYYLKITTSAATQETDSGATTIQAIAAPGSITGV